MYATLASTAPHVSSAQLLAPVDTESSVSRHPPGDQRDTISNVVPKRSV